LIFTLLFNPPGLGCLPSNLTPLLGSKFGSPRLASLPSPKFGQRDSVWIFSSCHIGILCLLGKVVNMNFSLVFRLISQLLSLLMLAREGIMDAGKNDYLIGVIDGR
jgi:hypothetical protein